MQFENYTPFAGLAWDNVNHENEDFITTLVRVRYKLVKSTSKNTFDLVLHEDQGELFDSDEYYGDLDTTSVRYESDYVQYKKHTDVVVNASSYSPKKEGDTAWTCFVKVYDNKGETLINYPLSIKATKISHKAGIIWTPTRRKKQKSVEVRYEKAFGGNISYIKDEEEMYAYTNPYNPVGCGVKKIKDENQYIYHPQVLYSDEKKRDIPAGYGFIEKSWQSRLDYNATYDDEWLENIHPLPPKDYDDYYNQAANPNMILKEYMTDGYKIELDNLHPSYHNFSFTIPKLNLISCLKSDIKDLYYCLNIDTLIVDINSEDENEHSVYISYRNRQQNKINIKESIAFIAQDDTQYKGLTNGK